MQGANGVLGLADEYPAAPCRFGVALAVAVAMNAGLLSLWTRWRAPEVASEAAPPTTEVIVLPRTARTRQHSMPSLTPHLPRSILSIAPPPAVFANPTQRTAPSGSEPPAPDPKIDPEWQVDGGAYLNPESAKQARALFEMQENLDFERACMGLSSKALDSTQRERCTRRWAALAARFSQ